MLPQLTQLPPYQGLSSAQAQAARQQYGPNRTTLPDRQTGWKLLREVASEPMFMLLAIATALYVLLGQWAEGVTLGIAMCLVAGISLYQSARSNNALTALQQLIQPLASVVRDGVLGTMAADEIVVGDLVWLTEGQTVPADGSLVQANDCAVDEAILTGESVPVPKTSPGQDLLFAGTTLVSGSAYYRVTAVGDATEQGRLGRSLQTVKTEKTPLQRQISRFVQRMAFVGFGAFGLVWGINLVHSGNWITSLLLGLTIAMSVLPEEIPVAFSSFMALGAARMIRFGVLTRQPQTVESLGSATVICTDKTGTITQDGMTLVRLYDATARRLVTMGPDLPSTTREVLWYARLASEPELFDPMEQAIGAAWQQLSSAAWRESIVQEYPLAGSPPMMTHLYADADDAVRVAGKGAVERIVRVCRLPVFEARAVLEQAHQLASEGYRVLGVAGCQVPKGDFPAEQDDFPWVFKGLLALENPPKPNAGAVLKQFSDAGIAVKMISGDSLETCRAIARQVDFPAAERLLTGQEVMALSEEALRKEVKTVNLFARMYPEAKLRVVRALKASGEVVAMTGDGVNDGPALKAAHIGIAMGKRGTELARQAASLILVDDDLESMAEAIAQGRRIYQNLKQAVGYIVAIHIPIILMVAVPLLLGWRYVNLFTPVHVIFLELVMGPTCSIAFENEPAEGDLMKRPPRRLSDTFFSNRELGLRVVQGLGITAATLGVYYQQMVAGSPVELVRSVTFTTLVLSNMGLTLVSRSGHASVLTTLRRPNALLWLMLALTTLVLFLFLQVPLFRNLGQFAPLAGAEVQLCLAASLAGVGWIELYKYGLRRRRPVRATA